MTLSSISDDGRPGVDYRDGPRHFQSIHSQVIDENCLHRAANSNETVAQRIHSQQSMIGAQLQHIDESLVRSTCGQTFGSGLNADRPHQELNGTYLLLLGIGSKFGSGSRPVDLNARNGHEGHHQSVSPPSRTTLKLPSSLNLLSYNITTDVFTGRVNDIVD